MQLSDLVFDTCRVYAALQDEMSRFLFEKRLMFNLTNDYKYIDEANDALFSLTSPQDYLSNPKKKVLFGFGGMGKTVFQRLAIREGVKFDCIIDNNASEKTNSVYDVLHASVFLNSIADCIDEYTFLISVDPFTTAYENMYRQLLSHSVAKSDIFDIKGIYLLALNPDMTPVNSEIEKKQPCQYFDLPELMLSDKEVFVDGGVADGKSSIDFSDFVNHKYEHIYAFEPNEKVLPLARNRFERHNLNFTLIQRGIYSCEKTLLFNNNIADASQIIDSIDGGANTKIETISLDKYFENTINKPTYIKLDIEGAELQGLIGSEKIIRQYKPKLAICIYHKNTDLLEIPQLILSYRPDYKFFIRKYWMPENVKDCEFVLYCV